MTNTPIQNFYPEAAAVCYGCGRHNEQGHHVQTLWDGEFGIARFTPKDYHTGYAGVVYGGLIASIIDCHAMGTAIAAKYEALGRTPNPDNPIAAVTGNLNISYRKPTPMGVELVFKSQVKEMHERKAIITCSLYVDDDETVQSETIAVYVPVNVASKEQK